MIIYLGRQLPAASSDLTRELKRATCYSPIWSCSRWGLPSRPVARPLVRSYRTVAPLPHIWGWTPEVRTWVSDLLVETRTAGFVPTSNF